MQQQQEIRTNVGAALDKKLADGCEDGDALPSLRLDATELRSFVRALLLNANGSLLLEFIVVYAAAMCQLLLVGS